MAVLPPLLPGPIRRNKNARSILTHLLQFRGIVVSGEAEDGEDLSAITVTDDNGNYTLPVTDGEWEVDPMTEVLARLGYVAPGSRFVTVAGSDAAGINLSSPRATTLVSGTVKDAETEQGLQGYLVNAQSAADGREAVAYPGADGTYRLGVVQGEWDIDIENSYRLFAAGCARPPDQHVTAPASGAVSGIDFLCRSFTMEALRWSTIWTGGLELQWEGQSGANYRIFWSTGSLGNGMTWQEVPNAQDDIRQEGDTMIWTDRGTAPGMNGSRPGDLDVRQRFYMVIEEPQ